jgi:hypothetical protein
MRRHCSICSHSARRSIEEAVLRGEAYRSVGGRFRVSRSAISRHRTDHHINAKLEKAAKLAEAHDVAVRSAPVLSPDAIFEELLRDLDQEAGRAIAESYLQDIGALGKDHELDGLRRQLRELDERDAALRAAVNCDCVIPPCPHFDRPVPLPEPPAAVLDVNVSEQVSAPASAEIATPGASVEAPAPVQPVPEPVVEPPLVTTPAVEEIIRDTPRAGGFRHEADDFLQLPGGTIIPWRR